MARPNVQPLPNRGAQPDTEALRRELAAAFRWAARFGYHEGVANHFSLAVSEDGGDFLVNPYGRHFSRLKASDLLLLDAETSAAETSSDGAAFRVDPTAWCIHAPIHRLVPRARCLLHVHSKYATVLTCLKDSSLPPIDQNTMRFYGKVAVDQDFEGMALTEAEGNRLAGLLGDKPVLLMGNHGVMVAGPTVAQAFDDLYYFERACETLVTAYATGKELRVVSDTVARQTVADWESYPDLSDRHFAELKAILDEEEPDYRN
ncbi:MAG: class II aldolase/adducin family protein [Kiloniellales bacterium]|nr:class II aldolase/adducin family protein [Kiloniellales bacterium]